MRIVSILIFMLLSVFGHAQSRLTKLDRLMRENAYAKAIPLWKIELESKDNVAYRAKLAYCYRMTNKMHDALTEYEKIIDHPRTRSDVYFYYAEALMSEERYDEAKDWFKRYMEDHKDDTKAPILINACNQVKYITPFYPQIQVTAFPQNSDFDDNSPVFWNGGIVFASDRPLGYQFLKEKSGWTDRDFLNLYYTRNMSDTAYTVPRNFSSKVNKLNKNMASASFTKDGKKVYFARNSSEPSKNNVYNILLYEGDGDGKGSWSNIHEMPFCSVEQSYMHPAISPDGKTLFFTSNKLGGLGGMDIYMIKKVNDKEWGKPQNLGNVINTAAHEAFPFMDAEGRLFFCSKGHVGYGGFDIFYTERNENGEWKKPVNIGKPINSAYDDISIFIAADGFHGIFTSARDGGDDDLYLFTLPER